jgi:Flp pilus assembly protein TadD
MCSTCRRALAGFFFALAFFAGISPCASAQANRRDLNVRRVATVKEWPASEKRWALIIGVDRYQDKQIGELAGASNDAKLLSETLVKYAGFPADQVILLSTAMPEERQPTRRNILQRLTTLTANVPKDGLFLFSFSGHGIARAGQAFLLPSDAGISDDVMSLEDTACPVSRVRDRIQSSGVQQAVVLLDACRSDPIGRADEPNRLTQAYTNAFNFYLNNRGITAFAILYATAVGERAYEYTEKRLGYFTWAVVDGIKGAAANETGRVTLMTLKKYVQETVPKRVAIDLGPTRRQMPFAVIEGYAAEDLVIAIAIAPIKPVSSGNPSVPAEVSPENTSARLSVSPELYEEIANTYLTRGQWEQAELAYRGALQTRPLDARLHNNLGVVLDRQGRWKEAEVAYSEAVRLAPDDAKYHDNLRIALVNQRKFAEAEKAAIKSARIEPTNPEWRNVLGDMLFLLNRWTNAEAAYREAIKMGTGNPKYHLNLGRALYFQARNAEAEVEFRRAVRLAPDNQAYKDELTSSLQVVKKWPEVEAAYRAAVQAEPNDHIWHYELGRALEKQKKRREAEAEYRAVVQLQPSLAWTHSALGRSLEEQEKWEAAEQEFREAVRLGPNIGEYHNSLSVVLRRQKKWTDAETEAIEALRLDTANAAEYKENLKRIRRKKH